MQCVWTVNRACIDQLFQRHSAYVDCTHYVGYVGDEYPVVTRRLRARNDLFPFLVLGVQPVPDIIRHGAQLHCYELKCYSPYRTTVALGHGSRECGGAASTANGGDFAFGNTRIKPREETLKSEAHHTEAIRHRFIAWNGMDSGS